MKYILGILNSSLFGWFVRQQSTDLRGGYIKFSKQYIEAAPIVIAEPKRHDELVELVERMLALKKQEAAAGTEFEKTAFARQAEATDRRIDELVYELYGLTDAEVKIVEESVT